jgi:hypothetical protein
MSDDGGIVHSFCSWRYIDSSQDPESVHRKEKIKSRSSKHVAYEQVKSSLTLSFGGLDPAWQCVGQPTQARRLND